MQKNGAGRHVTLDATLRHVFLLSLEQPQGLLHGTSIVSGMLVWTKQSPLRKYQNSPMFVFVRNRQHLF